MSDAGQPMRLLPGWNGIKKKSAEKKQSAGYFVDRLREAGHTFLDEDGFTGILRLERKRTERSGKPFLLMLLDVEGANGARDKEPFFFEAASSLFDAAREVDIKGWYAHDRLMGIIFPEIQDVSEKVTSKIFAKVYHALCRHLGVGTANKVKLSMHLFPETANGNGQTNGGGFDPNLYPDLSTKHLSRGFPFFFKRTLDVVSSLIAIAMLSPLLLVIAALVKFTSRGPVLFRQERVGLFGKQFTFLKFRSMYVDADQTRHMEYVTKFITESRGEETNRRRSENGHNTVYKLTDDPRITSIGRFIRKTSLDELPQFFNVLMGDMSLVGPRPPIPYECDKYDLWHRSRILEVKPGITGLWQVKGRSSTTFDEMVRLDLNYVKNWSLLLDLKILAQTPLAVVKGKGAY